MELSGKILLINPDQLHNFSVQEVNTHRGIQQFIVMPEEIYILNKAARSGSICTTNQILSDGSLYFIHSYDPLFLILPILRKQAGKARPLSNLLIEANCPSFETCIKLDEKLTEICEVIKIGDNSYYKLDSAKMNLWIDKKLQTLINGLRQSIKIASDGNNSEKIAIGILSEYLEDDLIRSLLERYFISFSDLSENPINSDLNPNKRLLEESKLQSNKKFKPAARPRQLKEERNQSSIMNFFRKT